MKTILIGAPIRQKPEILKQFLTSLDELKKDNIKVDYYFIDDNERIESSIYLERFKEKNKNVTIINSNDFDFKVNESYICEDDHYWKDSIILKVIKFKNKIIEYSIEKKYDYLFFIDSDLVLHPNTLLQLLEADKDIISNVFWTRWKNQYIMKPQVWLQDVYNMYYLNGDEIISKKEIEIRSAQFREKLKKPGVYKVGGLGACTLIRKEVLESGVNFDKLYNLSFWGEDRHFCIRAVSLGYDLFVDTHYPAYHIYREEDLEGIDNFKKNGFSIDDATSFKKDINNYLNIKINKIVSILKSGKSKIKVKKGIKESQRIIKENNKITLSMVVKNEENRYLKNMLLEALNYIDEAVIIDDASTDNTVKICREVLKDIPHKIIVNEKSMFSCEYKLRKKQWEETISTDPDWILFLDADEIFEDKFKEEVKELIKNKDVDVYCFRLFDMWDKINFRSDRFWNAHCRYVPFMIRYQPNFKYKFRKTNQHCGRLPKNINMLPFSNSEMRIKHYGWAKKEDRENKYKRYKSLDPKGKYGNVNQYESILDEYPSLFKFIEKY